MSRLVINAPVPAALPASGHRYWRWKFNALNGTGMTIHEIEFLLGGVDQTAPGGAASASEEFSGAYLAGNAVDDQDGAGHEWASSYSGAVPIYFVYDFLTPTNIDAVTIKPEGNPYGPSQFDIENSDDGSVWNNTYTSASGLIWNNTPTKETFTF